VGNVSRAWQTRLSGVGIRETTPTLRGRASAGRFAPPRSRGLVTFRQMRGARRQGAMAGRCEVTAPCAGIVCSRSVSG
jgi:hypothetical protein